MKKSLVLHIHSIAGLISAIFIFLLSLSGAALVFHDELDALQRVKVGPVAENKKIISIDSAYVSLARQYPHAEISQCELLDKTITPELFTIYDSSWQSGKKALQVFIDPQTRQVIQQRGAGDDLQHNFMSWLATFHNSFHLHKKGEWLLGVFALVFLISLLTGIVLYRKNIWAVLSFKRSVFKKGNLHQVIGTYALLFNMMIVCTGFWMERYVFKSSFYSSSDYERTIKTSPGLFFNVDSALQKIHERFPGFTARVIYFAQSPKGKTAVYGANAENSFIHSRKFADVIFLDSTGNISKTAFVNDIPAADRYDIINAQVHFGQYGGLPVKIIYCLFGLSGAVLSITGFVIWYRRKKGPLQAPVDIVNKIS